MTSSSTLAQCTAVFEQLGRMYQNEPWFKAVHLAKDDGGLHVDLVVHRSKLPPEGAPLLGPVLGVKVCTVVHG